MDCPNVRLRGILDRPRLRTDPRVCPTLGDVDALTVGLEFGVAADLFLTVDVRPVTVTDLLEDAEAQAVAALFSHDEVLFLERVEVGVDGTLGVARCVHDVGDAATVPVLKLRITSSVISTDWIERPERGSVTMGSNGPSGRLSPCYGNAAGDPSMCSLLGNGLSL